MNKVILVVVQVVASGKAQGTDPGHSWYRQRHPEAGWRGLLIRGVEEALVVIRSGKNQSAKNIYLLLFSTNWKPAIDQRRYGV